MLMQRVRVLACLLSQQQRDCRTHNRFRYTVTWSRRHMPCFAPIFISGTLISQYQFKTKFQINPRNLMMSISDSNILEHP
jgi:hypothetical protein